MPLPINNSSGRVPYSKSSNSIMFLPFVWEDTRKYITFTNKDGKKVRNKKLTEIFKEDFTKEALLNDFGRNGTAAAIDQIERELNKRETELYIDETERGEQTFIGAEQDTCGEEHDIDEEEYEPEDKVLRMAKTDAEKMNRHSA